ncbi:chymotrypsin-1-like [Aphidius gifuensis]|uniref:chymotrypsin-1-like n=1 Tax=Aphidius gifuensis TaxID=684658 RepID=UPI001CDC7824|nr:chymotrypsin-1-like [Aphidius gifuensis]
MRPIKFNANVQPVDLPTQDVIENTRVVLSGWGSQSCSLYSSIFLKKVELTITTKSLCQFYQHGDSGGPLVDGNTIIGIVSSGLPQYIGSPSFNCKVFDYLRWIDQIRKFTPPKIGCGGGPNPLFRL